MSDSISIPQLSSLPDISYAQGANKWADFIELSCLISDDGEYSGSDITTRIGTERGSSEEKEIFNTSDSGYEDEVFDEIIDVDADEAEQDDSHEEKLEEWFGLVRSRESILGEWYPFTLVDEDTIRLKSTLTTQQLLYLLLLVSSNTGFIKRGRTKLTGGFELLSREVMSWMYPGFACYVFGTSIPKEEAHFTGNITEKISQLACELNTSITRAFEQGGREDAGDGGLDIVAFLALDPKGAETSMLPLCLGQCSCSYADWKTKQGEVEISRWQGIIEKTPAVHELVFVPFPVRNQGGEWLGRDFSEIRTILIDRFRFLNLVATYSNDFEFFRRIKAYGPFLSMIRDLPAVFCVQEEAA